MPTLSHYLLLNHIKIKDANAISSPITYGFPAITGFLGAIHALNRKLPLSDIFLNGILIACHECDPKIHKNGKYGKYYFNLKGTPGNKKGEPSSIIEEGRVDLDISLVVKVSKTKGSTLIDDDEKKELEDKVKRLLFKQRMAGGVVEDVGNVELFETHNNDVIIKKLYPSFVLIDAKDELKSITTELQQYNPTANAFDALLECSTVHMNKVESNDKEEKWEGKNIKQGKGWLVAIPTGYQAIYPEFKPAELENCITKEYPSQYVETLYSLGKWVTPNNIQQNFENSFWNYNHEEKNLYLVTQS